MKVYNYSCSLMHYFPAFETDPTLTMKLCAQHSINYNIIAYKV